MHRLVILGVVEDYTNDYAHGQIHLRLSGIDGEAVIGRYLQYVGAYDQRLAEVARENLRGLLSLDFTALIERLVKELLEFIYRTVELGRRRSLAEMLQATTSGNLRRDILSYLQLGAYSEILASAMDRKEPLASALLSIANEISSPGAAAELRGETARLLDVIS